MSAPDQMKYTSLDEALAQYIPAPLSRTGSVEVKNATYRELISAASRFQERNHNALANFLIKLTARMKTYGVRQPKFLPYHILEKVAKDVIN